MSAYPRMSAVAIVRPSPPVMAQGWNNHILISIATECTCVVSIAFLRTGRLGDPACYLAVPGFCMAGIKLAGSGVRAVMVAHPVAPVVPGGINRKDKIPLVAAFGASQVSMAGA
jgi:hypothetical protein